jgi:hypothetical protein
MMEWGNLLMADSKRKGEKLEDRINVEIQKNFHFSSPV